MAGFWDGAMQGAGALAATNNWWAIGAGMLVGGIINSATSMNKEKEENKVKLGELENQLERQTADLEDLLEEGNLQIQNDTYARNEAAQVAANLMPTQNQAAYEQLNQVRMQAEQEVGNATAQVASSGFRNTGSAEKALTIAGETANRTVQYARTRAQISVYSNYAQLGQDYANATNRINAYQTALDNQEDKMKAEIDYTQQAIWSTKGELKELDDDDFAAMTEEEKKLYHNKTFGEEFWDFFS